jgi:hypothetical protein
MIRTFLEPGLSGGTQHTENAPQLGGERRYKPEEIAAQDEPRQNEIRRAILEALAARKTITYQVYQFEDRDHD